nr:MULTISPECIES: glycosyltransferase [Bacillaceae]
MALGKPVVTYIRPDLAESSFPSDLPIVNANPDNLFEQVKKLLTNPELRRQYGIKGRRYAEKYHSHDRVADQLIKIYSNLKV